MKFCIRTHEPYLSVAGFRDSLSVFGKEHAKAIATKVHQSVTLGFDTQKGRNLSKKRLPPPHSPHDQRKKTSNKGCTHYMGLKFQIIYIPWNFKLFVFILFASSDEPKVVPIVTVADNMDATVIITKMKMTQGTEKSRVVTIIIVLQIRPKKDSLFSTENRDNCHGNSPSGGRIALLAACFFLLLAKPFSCAGFRKRRQGIKLVRGNMTKSCSDYNATSSAKIKRRLSIYKI